MLDGAGYTMEDMVDMELARQESNWQQSLSETFETKTIDEAKPPQPQMNKPPKKAIIRQPIMTRATARRC